MTLSAEHEELVNDVRSAFWQWQRSRPEYENDETIWAAIEHCMAVIAQPDLPTNGVRRADMYIDLGDGYPVIVVEVGRMKDGKWKNFKYKKDGKPVRVLRIGFDRVAYMLHPRNTQREVDFLHSVQKGLDNGY